MRRWVTVIGLAGCLAACGAPATKAPAAGASCTPVPSGARAFKIAPGSATASYTAHENVTKPEIQKILHLIGIENTAIGKTDRLSGEIDLGSDLSLKRMKVTADLRTLTSDSSLRDERLQTQFLESKRYPWAVFTAGAVPVVSGTYSEGQDVHVRVPGMLTVREITKPFTLDVTSRLSGNTLTGTATGQLRMSDFGFDPPVIPGAIEVHEGLAISVNFTAQASTCTELPAQ